MDLGIGRGDSAQRVLGKKPTTLAQLGEAVRIIADLANGRATEYAGGEIRMEWARGPLPVWIAGYGPRALRLTGRIADGVILQFADPDLIRWCLGFVREGAAEAGRDPASIKVMAAAPVWVADDLEVARERVRWFPAELPEALTAYVQNRAGYDYQHHAEVGSGNAQFVADDVVDRFCIVGPVEEHRRRLREMAEAGVDQFNIYLMSGDEEGTLEVYGREIVPGLGVKRKA
jgi:alkanesulfonate monooxygenase SsuD/methylene tetrahydromethanopterin reductase-like flavin-dependent oxidoreductase (luciferase family)